MASERTPSPATALIAPEALQVAVAALLAWYDAERRDLPWRQTRDPYRIWLSEVLLQQTQVATALPYYARLVERYPTVEALAASDLNELLALWQGLGYYARARSLRRAAQQIVAQHGGRLPQDYEALLALPGIGEYTAGAVLSIAFGLPTPAIDGNVRRVLARLFDLAKDLRTPEMQRWLTMASLAMLPPERAGDYNQAMMELGASLCRPRDAACGACPLRQACLAHDRGTASDRPVRPPRRQTPTHERVAAHCLDNDRLLIVRRLPSGLLGGLWELPNFALPPNAAPTAALQVALAPHAPDALPGEELTLVRHAYTHFSVRVHVLACTLTGFVPSGEWDACHWLALDELERYGLTGVALKAMRQGPWLAPRLL